MNQPMTATVVPKFVNDPKPGKTNYSVKDENNVLWSVKPGDIHKFAKGQATVVEYTVFQGNNGFTMNMVERADAPQSAPQSPQSAAAYVPPAAQAAPASPAAPSGDIESPPILSNALGRYLMNPNCRFNFETPEEFGQFVKRVQQGYVR